jgi:hypothetical protein
MKIAIFGSANTIFIHSYIKLLEELGHDLLLLNNSNKHSTTSSINYLMPKKIKKTNGLGIIKKIFKLLHLDKQNIFIENIEKKDVYSSLKKEEKKLIEDSLSSFLPDVVVFFWGTTLRREAAFVDSLNIPCRKILLLNTYPTRTKFNIWSDNKFLSEDREYFSIFDELILPSNNLKEVFQNSSFLKKSCRVIVNPDFLYIDEDEDEVGTTTDKIKNIGHRKKLIFLGNTNFSERSIDDVSKLIKELAFEGVEIYLQKSNDAVKYLKKTENVKFFEPFSFEAILRGKLLSYINNFDGVLYCYKDLSKVRYHGSITTRLLLAESAKVPVYIFGEKPHYSTEKLLAIDIISVDNCTKLLEHLSNNYISNIDIEKYNCRVNKITEIFKG